MIVAERLYQVRQRRLEVAHGTGPIAGFQSDLGPLNERTAEMDAAA